MTKKGIIYIPMTMHSPDRWLYAFDGQTLKVVEEFDDVPNEEMEMAIKYIGQLGFEVKREGNVLSFMKELTQDKAIEFCISEFLGQAVVSGLISRETAVHVWEEAAKAKSVKLNTIPTVLERS